MPVADAAGAVLAHTLHAGARVLKKGRVLDAADLAALAAAGIAEAIAARLDPGDLDEDAAAAAVATALAGPGVRVAAAHTGRANLFATAGGVVRVAADAIGRANQLDEAVTVATVADDAPTAAGAMVATVKIIPFAVTRELVERCRAIAAGGPLLRLAPLAPRRAALILGELPGMKENVFRGTVTATRNRLEGLGSRLALVLRCRHRKGLLRREVVEEGALGHPRRRAEVIDGRRAEPLAPDHRHRGVEQPHPSPALARPLHR